MIRSIAVVAPVMAFAVLLAGCGDDATRQDEVAQRGAEVMPFNLDATMHEFEPTATGGVQSVVADDPGDDAQVALVREHLAAEADKFREGDFDDPEAIHGPDMPGLAALQAGFGAIEVTYAPTDAGAQLTYETGDAALVEAIHTWFAAQVSDHGKRADMHGDGAG